MKKYYRLLAISLSALCSSCWLFSASLNAKEQSAPIAFAIHGGAGTITKANLSEQKEKKIRAKLQEAVKAGYQKLSAGESGLIAVQTAITILEDSPLFNAGIGAVYTFNGEHELDASIMDGKTLNAGAVAGVKRIKNPIQLAMQVMNHSNHVMLTGEGAEEFAEARGIMFADNHMFDSQFRHKAWEKAKAKMEMDKQAFYKKWPDYKYGTVGAVALDKQGNLAAGTSTGGMTMKRYGRVGDSPIIGAGTYADNNSCAVSATGHGEYFIRYNVAADICARVKYKGESAEKASNDVIHKVLKSAGGSGGVIVLDSKGNVSMPYNTEGMYRASVNANGEILIGIY